MKSLKLHITIYFILIWSFSFAQEYANYTTKDGLPSNHVYKIAQDNKGFVWFATDKGLVKYNGNTMKTFSTKNGLATNDIWEVFPTPNGKLWYLSKASKLGYIKNDSVYAFESEQKEEIFNPIYTSQVGNDIILTSPTKFHTLRNDKWKVLKTYNHKDSVPYNDDYSYIKHPILSGYKTSELFDSISIQNKNNKTIKVLNLISVLKRIHRRGQITDSLFYWVDNYKYTFLNLNTLELKKRTFKKELGIAKSKNVRINLVNNQIQITGKGFVGVLDNDLHIKNTFYIPDYIKAHFGFIDKTGSVWLPTFTNGIYHLPIEKQNIKYCLPEESITNITYVNNKIIASVFNKGFYEYNNIKKKFLPFIKDDDYIYSAFYIKELDTEYYLTKLNIRILKNKKIKKIERKNYRYEKNSVAKQLVFYNNFLYGKHSFGINTINPNNFKIRKEYIQEGISQLFVFNNLLLVATTSGLKKFKDEIFTSFIFNNQEFNKPILNIIKISNTEVLINTDGFGAYISDLKTLRQLPGTEFLIVNTAFIDKNNIWLATESGILKYTKIKKSYTLQLTITKNDGLPSNNVNDLLLYEDKLMACTNKGIVILPQNIKITSHLLDIYIDKASYNNQNITSSNTLFKYQENNNISITVSSIDYSENSNFTYNYKLEPLQNNWKTTKTTNINFNELKPDNYIFKIKSNTLQKQIEFTIVPLWYQTIWFKVLTILILVSLFFSSVWYLSKKNQQEKNKKLLQEKQFSEIQLKALRSQMNPHFVFNSLAAIQYYINENNFEASEKYLVKFSKLIRQFFELSKETTITLTEEMKLLSNYLEIEKLRFKEKLEYEINIDNIIDADKTKIPTMLLQPIVENAVNHGVFNKYDTGTVTINFSKVDAKTYKVSIIDDGVGFVNTKSKNKKVKSSSVLKERLTYLNTSDKWEIQYFKEELYPKKEEKGNKSIFIIKSK